MSQGFSVFRLPLNSSIALLASDRLNTSAVTRLPFLSHSQSLRLFSKKPRKFSVFYEQHIE